MIGIIGLLLLIQYFLLFDLIPKTANIPNQINIMGEKIYQLIWFKLLYCKWYEQNPITIGIVFISG
jgi:hypothetical protein